MVYPIISENFNTRRTKMKCQSEMSLNICLNMSVFSGLSMHYINDILQTKPGACET